MKNKTKKILATACLGLVGFGCMTGCERRQKNYELTVINDSQYGIISPVLDNETNSVTVDRGDDYTFTITPSEGYEIKNLLIDGKLVDPQSVYTFADIESDHSIGAIYARKIKSFTINYMHIMDIVYKNAEDYTGIDSSERVKFTIGQGGWGIYEGNDDFVEVVEFEEKIFAVGDGQKDGITAMGHLNCWNMVNIYGDLNVVNDKVTLCIKSFYNSDSSISSVVKANISDIQKFESINDESVYKDNLYVVDFKGPIEFKTIDGKELKISSIRLVCEANY